jgi:hypothetical protein
LIPRGLTFCGDSVHLLAGACRCCTLDRARVAILTQTNSGTFLYSLICACQNTSSKSSGVDRVDAFFLVLHCSLRRLGVTLVDGSCLLRSYRPHTSLFEEAVSRSRAPFDKCLVVASSIAAIQARVCRSELHHSSGIPTQPLRNIPMSLVALNTALLQRRTVTQPASNFLASSSAQALTQTHSSRTRLRSHRLPTFTQRSLYPCRQQATRASMRNNDSCSTRRAHCERGHPTRPAACPACSPNNTPPQQHHLPIGCPQSALPFAACLPTTSDSIRPLCSRSNAPHSAISATVRFECVSSTMLRGAMKTLSL